MQTVYKNLSFIQLETNAESLLSFIDKVEIYKDRIYVFGHGAIGVRKVCCFDLQGKFLFNIDRRGNGPEEYLSLTDFVIDKKTQCLWLVDHAKKMLKFDLDGNFIEQYSTDFFINNISLMDDENKMAIRLGDYKDENYSFINYSYKDKKILYHQEAPNTISSSVDCNVITIKHDDRPLRDDYLLIDNR